MKTEIGKELIGIGEKKGIQKGRQEGISKGELIGEIRAMQKVLKRPVTPLQVLARKGRKMLKMMLAELEKELASVQYL